MNCLTDCQVLIDISDVDHAEELRDIDTEE